MRLALVLGQRQQRRVPRVGAQPLGVGDGQAGVVADLGAGDTFDLVFVKIGAQMPVRSTCADAAAGMPASTATTRTVKDIRRIGPPVRRAGFARRNLSAADR